MSGNNTKFYVLYDSELMMENDAVICEFVYKFVGLKKKKRRTILATVFIERPNDFMRI